MHHLPVQRIPWSPGGKSIPFLLGDCCIDRLPQLLRPIRPDRVLIVSEQGLPRRVLTQIRAVIPPALPTKTLIIPPGESAKTLATIDQIANQALAAGHTRRSVIIAVGGGRACNIAGMLAGTLFRGVPLIHLPTTLLAMHDTVTSLKQAVNIGGYKNLAGLYHRPSGILCDVSFCESLPHEAIQGALVEIVKNALLLGGRLVDTARTLCAASGNPNAAFCIEVIKAGVAAKQSLMASDPFERGQAIGFEYGHTVGHALESLCPISHGHGIYWGMSVAGEVAAAMGLMSQRAIGRHRAMLALLEPMPLPSGPVSLRSIMAAVGFDNKRGHLPPQAGQIQMVLLREIGKPLRTGVRPLCDVPIATLQKQIAALPFVR